MIKTGRRSAGLTRHQLARLLGTTTAQLRAWETGTAPLYCEPYPQLRRIASTLSQTGAVAGADLAELLLASQCDLLITRMLTGTEDYAEIPPIDENTSEGKATRALLRWALTSQPPAHYGALALRGPLLSRADAERLHALGLALQLGARGSVLVPVGAVIASLSP